MRERMKVAIGTHNRAKVKAVQNVLHEFFDDVEFQEVNVPSNVSNQPFSDEETRQGAINRAINALEATGADMNFGLEGGVQEIDGMMYCCNWGALALKDGQVLTAAGAQFMLPDEIAAKLKEGQELGPVIDEWVNEKDTRHHQGAIGVLTAGLIDRTEMFEHIVKNLIGQYFFMQNKK